VQTLNFETVTVDNKGTINNRRKLNAKYFTEDLGNGVTLEMVQIPGGTFTIYTFSLLSSALLFLPLLFSLHGGFFRNQVSPAW
jgi:hypothetical protein